MTTAKCTLIELLSPVTTWHEPRAKVPGQKQFYYACTQDVLQAAEGDVNAAAWMLTELHSSVTPGMSPQLSPSISPWASPLGSPLGSPHVSPARSHMAHLSSPRTPDLPTIAERAGQNSRPTASSKQKAPSASRESVRPAGASRHSERKADMDISKDKHANSAASDTADHKLGRDEEQGDAYHSFRGEALQLTRRWQRAAHKATSAFSGDSCGLCLQCSALS